MNVCLLDNNNNNNSKDVPADVFVGRLSSFYVLNSKDDEKIIAEMAMNKSADEAETEEVVDDSNISCCSI